jgi:FAD/FMN-containing dehydrogenase
MTVEAGATLQAVQEAADLQGLQFSLDLGARGSCTIGGNAATNAGGNRVIRYGMMRDLVLDLEAVLPNGEIIGGRNSMLKDNAGYDLKQLMIGSEGTLGVITSLTLKLHPKQDATIVSLCAAESLDAIIDLLGVLRKRSEGRLSAFEIMWDDYFEQAIGVNRNLRRPFAKRHAIYALIEFQGQDLETLKDMTESFLMDTIKDGILADVIIGQSLSDNEDIWTIRDAISELLTLLQPLIAFDISIPLVKTGDFVREAETIIAEGYPGSKAITFGHLGDGNLHLTIYKANQDDLHAIESEVLSLVGDFNGSISGEHGIGIIKKPYLHHSKTKVEIALMQTIKKAIDPNNILNPGRIIDAAQ